jgi:ATP-dependent helicase/nuclease subunit B
MLEACDIFLRTEEEACRTVTPKYFEVSFGFEETEGIAMPEPFSLPLGGGKSVRLRGRVDRIDHDETAGEWHVWDYKSGSTYKFDIGGRLRCGTRVQHAIYARAVAAMLARTGEAGNVSRSGYLFPTGKGRGARLLRECTDQELKEALNLLFDVIGSGFFPHAEEDACRFCDFTAVCGSARSAAERMRRKLFFNAGREEVAAWRRLQDVR